MKQVIIEKYKQGQTMKGISRETGVHFNSIRNLLIVEGLLIPKVSKLTGEQLQEVEERFSLGESISKLSKEYGVGHSLLSDYLRAKGIDTLANNKKYSYDRSVFKTIDSEEKAYWLGFILADGYVSDKGLEIGLNIKDRTHLQKFCKFIGIDESAIKVKGETTVRVIITSVELVQDLLSHGIKNKKSLIADFNHTILNGELARHYLRGYFDGDGYMSKDGNRSEVTCGSTVLLNSWQDHLRETLSIEYKRVHSDNRSNAKRLRYSKKDTLALKQYLYNDSAIFLNRKAKL